MQGILKWVVDGAIAWYARGAEGLGTPPSVENETARQRSEQDYTAQFLDACIDEKDGGFVTFSDLYRVYKQWCRDTSLTGMKQRSFSLSMSAKGLQKMVKWMEVPTKATLLNNSKPRKKQARGFYDVAFSETGEILLDESYQKT